MIRPLECFIGLRYLSTGRGQGFVSFMSAASFIGIALGVAALLVILSAMNGLEAESRVRLLSMAEHITVRPGAADDFSWDTLAAELVADAAVESAVPFVHLEGMLAADTRIEPVLVRGVDPAAEGERSDLAGVVGTERLAALAAGSNRVILGQYLAGRLGVEPGDRVTLYLAEAAEPYPRPRAAALVVAGGFYAGVEEHDSRLALVHLADASALAGLAGRPEGLALKLADPMRARAVEAALAARSSSDFRWSNWADENRSLYEAMAIEKTMMTIVLMFIVAVAAFNIVASLMMTVNEKAKDIAILRTMGLSPKRVTRVFFVQGALLGVAGTLVGVLLGLVLAVNLETILPWLEQTFGFQIMPGDVFYVTDVPSEIRMRDFVSIPSIALVIALAATVFPARRAARIDPAEVLRYE
jgi:lipoprotein-releasing system permease protein